MRCRSIDGAPGRPGPVRRECGSVTAETALALPALVVVLAALLGAGKVAIAQITCVDAARAGARAAARADPAEQVGAVAQALAPGARVTLRRASDFVRVDVSAQVRVPLPVPSVPVHCAAVGSPETPDAAPGAARGTGGVSGAGR